MLPKLSVIVPVYNTEKYLHQCLSSIINQSYDDFELILIDDGSTDSSGKICDSFAEKYDCVRVSHQQNCGCLKARKNGVRLAKGEYITFVDSDDWIDSHMYKNMMNNMQKYNSDIVVCDMLVETGKKTVECKNSFDGGFYDKPGLKQVVYPNMLFNIQNTTPGINPSFCNKIFKKSILKPIIEKVNDSVVYGEDAICCYAYWLDCSCAYIMTGEYYYHYRNNPDSIVNGYDSRLFDKMICLAYSLSEQFRERKFNDNGQLFAYIARYSLECIRAEYLRNTHASVHERINNVKRYIENPAINEAFLKTEKRILQKKVRFKMRLVNKRHLFFLFVLMYFKSIFLVLKV